MKKPEPCDDFVSKDPGAGAHYPDPCRTCGWASPDHASYWLVRDTNERKRNADKDRRRPEPYAP